MARKTPSPPSQDEMVTLFRPTTALGGRVDRQKRGSLGRGVESIVELPGHFIQRV